MSPMLTPAELAAAEASALRRLHAAQVRRQAMRGRNPPPAELKAVEDAAEQAVRDLLAAQSLLALRTTYAVV